MITADALPFVSVPPGSCGSFVFLHPPFSREEGPRLALALCYTLVHPRKIPLAGQKLGSEAWLTGKLLIDGARRLVMGIWGLSALVNCLSTVPTTKK